MARPVSPPFESTSSWTSVTQSATTFGRLPGTVRISFRVGMAGNLHHRAPAWYACRDGPLLTFAARVARGADGAKFPELPRSVHPRRGADPDVRRAAHVGDEGRIAPVRVHPHVRDRRAAVWLAGRPPDPLLAGRHRRLRMERGDGGVRPRHQLPRALAGARSHGG